MVVESKETVDELLAWLDSVNKASSYGEVNDPPDSFSPFNHQYPEKGYYKTWWGNGGDRDIFIVIRPYAVTVKVDDCIILHKDFIAM